MMSLREALEKVPADLWKTDHLQIAPLQTEKDLIYAAYECQLSEEQQALVNPAWYSIGRAYLSPQDNYPCIIYNGQKKPVGFISFGKWLAEGDACTWSYFIQKEQQERGYGKSAARLAVQILKAAAPQKPIKLATEACNERAQSLYRSLGFQLLPEKDGDDLVFAL